MSDYDVSTYGDRIADVYDERYGGNEVLATDAAVALLAELAGAGPALELGIGTGRVALPLAASGLEVHGIDASQAMVDRLRAKHGGEAIPVTMGDFADAEPPAGPYTLTYVVFNTLFALLTQEGQVRCFENVARHLSPGGAFVVEAFVPDLSRFDRGQRVDAIGVGTDSVDLSVAKHDAATQMVVSAHVVIQEVGTRLYPVNIRYAWPSELDLMARLAGMRPRDRWGGWGREPFTGESTMHVSVYERAPETS